MQEAHKVHVPIWYRYLGPKVRAPKYILCRLGRGIFATQACLNCSLSGLGNPHGFRMLSLGLGRRICLERRSVCSIQTSRPLDPEASHQ